MVMQYWLGISPRNCTKVVFLKNWTLKHYHGLFFKTFGLFLFRPGVTGCIFETNSVSFDFASGSDACQQDLLSFCDLKGNMPFLTLGLYDPGAYLACRSLTSE